MDIIGLDRMAIPFVILPLPAIFNRSTVKGGPAGLWLKGYKTALGVPTAAPDPPTAADLTTYSPPITRGRGFALRGFRTATLPTINPPRDTGVGRPKGKPFLERVPSTDNRAVRASEKLSVIINSLLVQGYIVQTGQASFALRGGALVRDRAPTNADDGSVEGVLVGVPWIDTTTSQIYFCLRADLGNAAWIGPLG